VEQHEVGLLLARQQKRLLAVGRCGDAEALALQVVAQQRHQRRLVLDDEDEWVHRVASAARAPGSGGSTTEKLVLSLFGLSASIGRPSNRKWMVSAMLVAWSPIRSMFLAMNSRCVQGLMLRGSSIM